MEFLDKIIAAVPGNGWTFYPMVFAVTQLMMARFPSAKPLGWFWLAAGILHRVGALAEKVASFIDGIFPQKTQ